MSGKPPHIFLSYARSDALDHVERLERDLNIAGFATWRDKRNMDHYHDFTGEIEFAIRDASHVVVLITPAIGENPESFVRREIIYAQEIKKPIIPLKFPNAVMPIVINHLTWISFFNGDQDNLVLRYDEGLTELLERLSNTQQLETYRKATQDPFHPYLSNLLEQLVNLLEKNRFIHLESQSREEAVVRHSIPFSILPKSGLEQNEPKSAQGFLHFFEAFEKYQGRVLLLGDPGAGKTTTLNSFAREAVVRRLADPREPLPILVSIAQWDTNRKPAIKDWIASLIPELRKELASVIIAGNAILLLDGLDELGSARVQALRTATFGITASAYSDQEFVHPETAVSDTSEEKIRLVTAEMFDPRREFINLLPENNRIIITCRIKDYDEMEQKVSLNGAVALQPLTDEQMKSYLGDLPELWDVIESDVELRNVARTPLILNLFATAFAQIDTAARQLRDLSKGDQRDKIFEYFIRQTYLRESKKHPESMTVALDELIHALQELAFHNFDSRFSSENVISMQEISSVLPDETHRKNILEIASLLSFLVHIRNGSYRFVHLLLRDYFAYYAALRFLQASDLEKRESAIRALQTFMEPRSAQSVIDFALCDVEASIRYKAADLLGDLKFDSAADPLMVSLYDEHWWVRESAARALGKLKENRALDMLIASLSDDNIDVRASVIKTLGELGDPRSIAVMIPFLSSNEITSGVHNRSGLSHITALTFGKFGEAALSPIVDILKSGDDTGRIYAADALGYIGNPAAVEALINALSDPYPAVRWSAAYALGTLGDTAAVEPLIQSLNDEDVVVKNEATYALGLLGDSRAIPPMISLFADNSETDYQQGGEQTIAFTAAKAIAKLQGDVFAALSAALSSDLPAIRGMAAFALSMLDDPRAVSLLGRMLDDKATLAEDDDSSVCDMAIIALTAFGAPAVEVLATRLKDPDAELRSSVVNALGKIKDAHTLQLLSASVRDSEAMVRLATVVALAEFEDPQVFMVLLPALRDSDTDVRRAVVNVLGQMRDKRAVQPLLGMLNDPEPTVRQGVIKALSELQDNRAVQPIGKRLTDGDLEVRMAAVEALNNLSAFTEATFDTELKHILYQDSFNIRIKTAEMLARSNDLRALEPLIMSIWDDRVTDDMERGRIFDSAWELAKLTLPSEDAHHDFFKALDCIVDTKLEESLSFFATAITKQTDRWYFYYWRSSVAFGWLNRDVEQALADFSMAIDLAEKSGVKLVDLYRSRAAVYDKLNKPTDADADYDKALQLEPDNAETYLKRGKTYYERSQYELALADLEHARQLRPENNNCLNWIGITYDALKRYREAIETYTQAISSGATEEYYFSNRGRSYYNNFQYTLALADFSRSVEIAPDDASTWSWVARAHYCLGSYENALNGFNRAVEIQPDDADWRGWRGQLLCNLGRYQEALDDHIKALELGEINKDSAVTQSIHLYFRAIVYLVTKQFKSALQDFQDSESRENTPRSPTSIAYSGLWRAVIATLTDNLDEAKIQIGHAAEAAEQFTDKDDIPFIRALLAIAQDNRDEARRNFEIFLDLGNRPKPNGHYYLYVLEHVFPERSFIREIREWYLAQVDSAS